jgi:hypothetical protein
MTFYFKENKINKNFIEKFILQINKNAFTYNNKRFDNLDGAE